MLPPGKVKVLPLQEHARTSTQGKAQGPRGPSARPWEREPGTRPVLEPAFPPLSPSPLRCFPDAFLEQAVSYQQFVDNPALIDDPNLVVKIGNKYVSPEASRQPVPGARLGSAFRRRPGRSRDVVVGAHSLP